MIVILCEDVLLVALFLFSAYVLWRTPPPSANPASEEQLQRLGKGRGLPPASSRTELAYLKNPFSWKHRYRWLFSPLVALPLALLAISLSGVLWLSFFLGFVWLHGSILPNSLYILRPYVGWLLCTPLFGCFGGLIGLDMSARLLMRRHYAEFVYADSRYGGAVRKMYAILLLVVVGPVVAAVTLEMDCYTRFEKNGFAANNYLGFGEIYYPYSSVTDVVKVSLERNKKGEITDMPRIYLYLADGSRWNQADYGFGYSEKDDDWVGLVCAGSGKPLRQVPFIEDVNEEGAR